MAKRAPRRVPAPLAVVLALVGASAVVAQVVLLRELLLAFGGNEMAIGIMLAAWLLWSAMGSGLLSRISWKRGARSRVAGLQVAAAFLLPCTVWAVRASRGVFHAMPGEILGPVPMLACSFSALAPFCAASGWLFTAGVGLLVEQRAAQAPAGVSSMYLLEAVGSAAGGILASFLLLPWLNSFQIAMVVGIANLASATFLVFADARSKIAAWTALALAFAPLLLLGRTLDRITIASQWPGFRLLSRANSRYGDLAVLENETSRTLLENGLPIASVPDPQAAEETVHFALLQHPAPRSLLLIGGGLNGSVQQALRHPSLERVDYVELDPEVLRLARRYFSEEWAAATANPRVHVRTMDGRLFLQTNAQQFDVIIAGLPGPHTAQLNRFYTREFFQEAARRLAPGGVLSFQLRAAENYISPDLGRLLRSMRETLRHSFAEVAVIPGDSAVFLASNRRGILTTNPAEIAGRLRARNLQTGYVREYYLPFRLAPDRVADLERQLAPQPDTQVNRDFAPLAYYLDVVLWSGQFSEAYRRFFAALAAMPFRRVLEATVLLMLTAAGLLRWRGAARRSSAAFCVVAMGFTLLALEVFLLLGFQAIYGYVYHQLAIIIAAFMAGMAIGSWRALRRVHEGGMADTRAMRWLLITQLLAALSPVLLYTILTRLFAVQSAAGSALIASLVFPLLALAAGGLGGYQFPLANHIYFADRATTHSGTLYGLDLAGACAGALLISAYLVPVFGFLRTSELIGIVNLIPAALALIVTRRSAPVGG